MGEKNQCPLRNSRDLMEGCTCRSSLLLLPLHAEASLESSVTSAHLILPSLVWAFQLRLSSIQTGSYCSLLSSSPGSHLGPSLVNTDTSHLPKIHIWYLGYSPSTLPADKLLTVLWKLSSLFLWFTMGTIRPFGKPFWPADLPVKSMFFVCIEAENPPHRTHYVTLPRMLIYLPHFPTVMWSTSEARIKSQLSLELLSTRPLAGLQDCLLNADIIIQITQLNYSG